MAANSKHAEGLRKAVCLTALMAAILAPMGQPAIAADAAAIVTPTSSSLLVEVSQAKTVPVLSAASSVFIANPDIADVQVPSDGNGKSVIVFGKKPGLTTLLIRDRQGRSTRYSIEVTQPAVEIEAALLHDVPNAQVHVSSTPSGMIVTGTAPSPGAAEKLRATARQFLGEKENLIFNVGVSGETQVNLQVRVAQVSRTVDKQFGFNWSAIFNNNRFSIGLLTGRAPVDGFGNFIRSTNSTSNPDSLGFGYRSRGGSANVSGLIDALQDEGLVSVLAEPNLTAVSGETANFLAGGEFPVPVPQGLQEITIDWKRFGVSIDFTPTVIDGNRISIKVRPEVSELSSAGAITVQGIQVPALTVRRADTTVELGSGESFAIAGLFQNNVNSDVQRYPWLGDIPILGALFRSSSFQRQESELVIIVTPYLVKPMEHVADAALPTDGLTFATDLEQVLWGKLTHQESAVGHKPDDAPHFQGPAGFSWE